jgi:hypothetical protein
MMSKPKKSEEEEEEEEEEWKGLFYLLEYTDISEMFFKPHQDGHCCINVIRR